MPGEPAAGPSAGCCSTRLSISPGRRRATRPARRHAPATPHVATGPPRRGEWIQPWAWRQAWRSLARRPAFLGATVLTLAFGAGVSTAVFSLVDTVLIKPLPYPDADSLVTVYELSPSARDRRSLVAPGRLEDWHRLNRSFVAISGTNTESVTDTSATDPERLAGVRVSPRFFQVYARQPVAGRWFTADEERETGAMAVVISERFWARRFNRAPSAIGRALVIGGKGYPIVGVMPASFAAATIDVWLPAKTSAWLLGHRDARFVNGVGRLKPGVTIEQAARDLALVQEDLARQFPKTDTGWSVEVRSLKEARDRRLTARARRGLRVGRRAVADCRREHRRAHAGAGAPAGERARDPHGARSIERPRHRPGLAGRADYRRPRRQPRDGAGDRPRAPDARRPDRHAAPERARARLAHPRVHGRARRSSPRSSSASFPAIVGTRRDLHQAMAAGRAAWPEAATASSRGWSWPRSRCA